MGMGVGSEDGKLSMQQAKPYMQVPSRAPRFRKDLSTVNRVVCLSSWVLKCYAAMPLCV